MARSGGGCAITATGIIVGIVLVLAGIGIADGSVRYLIPQPHDPPHIARMTKDQRRAAQKRLETIGLAVIGLGIGTGGVIVGIGMRRRSRLI